MGLGLGSGFVWAETCSTSSLVLLSFFSAAEASRSRALLSRRLNAALSCVRVRARVRVRVRVSVRVTVEVRVTVTVTVRVRVRVRVRVSAPCAR